MTQTWMFYEDGQRTLRARGREGSRWVKVQEGDCEAVIFLSESQTRRLIEQLQETLPAPAPAQTEAA